MPRSTKKHLLPSQVLYIAKADPCELGPPLSLRCRQFHHIRTPKEPIDAHVEPVGNFGEPVNVECLKPGEMKIYCSSAETVMGHLAKAASLRKMIVQN